MATLHFGIPQHRFAFLPIRCDNGKGGTAWKMGWVIRVETRWKITYYTPSGWYGRSCKDSDNAKPHPDYPRVER